MEGDTVEKVDKTICAICDWVEKGLQNTNTLTEDSILPGMVMALAELITARAQKD